MLTQGCGICATTRAYLCFMLNHPITFAHHSRDLLSGRNLRFPVILWRVIAAVFTLQRVTHAEYYLQLVLNTSGYARL